MEAPVRVILIGVAAAVIAFVTGFLGGYHANVSRRLLGAGERDSSLLDLFLQLTSERPASLSGRLMNEISADNIREYLRTLTRYPRVAGTAADRRQADELRTLWEESGFDRATLYPYDVLLSYPDTDRPNRIVIHDEQGRQRFSTQIREKVLDPDQNRSDIFPPYSAYSASGEPKGDLIYVNYATRKDFLHLRSLGIDPSGQICIARSGMLFRGDKAKIAEEFRCAGLILYAEPEPGQDKVYPDSIYLPGSGVAHGSLHSYGDPLTPGYPAKDYAYRIRTEEAGLPTIPVQPIGYDDARVLLGNLTGPEAGSAWVGELPITYRLGPGFVNDGWKVQMFVSTKPKNVTTYNAVGFVRGHVEPDRYVVLGNHRDTWVLGAIDPTGGTAAMMELSRAMGTLLKEGWRPRRSIIFCSWGAEEFGLMGSREWVEEFGKILEKRTVAYVNVDVAVLGNFTFRGKAMPLMSQLMYDVAKAIPNPNPHEVAVGHTTVYDTWRSRMPEKDLSGYATGLPQIGPPTFGSDYASFICVAGITSADLRYQYDTSALASGYSLYHTGYETFHLVDTYYDPGLVYHRVITQFWGELTLRLADDYVIPFDVRGYGKFLRRLAQRLVQTYRDLFSQFDIDVRDSLDYLTEATIMFENASQEFSEALERIDLNNPLAVRMVNDKLMYLDRVFIDPNGLPSFSLQSAFFTRNVLYGQAQSYAGSLLPALLDVLNGLETASTASETSRSLDDVRRQLAIITHWIRVAGSSLRDDTQW